MLSSDTGIMSIVQRLQGHAGPVVCAAAASDGQVVMSGDEEGTLCCFEASTLQPKFQARLGSADDDAVTSVCSASDPHVLYASVGTSVHAVDIRSGTAPVATFRGVCKDEINQVAVDMKATHIATADDAGDVKVFDLTACKLFKCMRGAHGSMATCVSFRPHRPWELISGGMDSTVARWDFSKGKCLSRWQMSQPTGHEERQVFNPPFVHALAVPGVASSVRPWCQLVAAARGDGAVMVFDADQPPSVTASLLQQQTDKIATSGVPDASSTSTSAGSTSAVGGSTSTSAGNTRTAGGSTSAAGGHHGAGNSKQLAGQQEAAGKKTNGHKQGRAGQCSWVGPMSWGAEHGGHTRPASCVTYSWAGCTAGAEHMGPPWLVSGSEDRQLIVWQLQHHATDSAADGDDCGLSRTACLGEEAVMHGLSNNGEGSRRDGSQLPSSALEGGASRAEDLHSPGSGKGAAAGHVALAVRHVRKINCVAAGRHSSQQLLFVGDTGKMLAVYQLPHLA